MELGFGRMCKCCDGNFNHYAALVDKGKILADAINNLMHHAEDQCLNVIRNQYREK